MLHASKVKWLSATSSLCVALRVAPARSFTSEYVFPYFRSTFYSPPPSLFSTVNRYHHLS